MKQFIFLFVAFLAIPSLAAPTVQELKANAAQYFKIKALNGHSMHQINLSKAVPKNFYSIDRFNEFSDLTREVSRIVGIFEVERPDSKVVRFALFFDEKGQPLQVTGAMDYSEDTCVPFYFYNLGSLDVRYHALSTNADLWILRNDIVRALSTFLTQKSMTSYRESLSVSLRPNEDQYERQQALYISGALALYEVDIIEGAKKLNVSGIAHIDGGPSRWGYPTSGWFGGTGAVCAEIK